MSACCGTHPGLDARAGVETVDPAARAAAEIVIISGSQGFTANEMDALPKLAALKTVVLAPHIAGLAHEAQQAMRPSSSATSRRISVVNLFRTSSPR